DDIGDFADGALEQLGGLDDRQADLLIAVTGQDLGHGAFKVLPQRTVGGQDVVHAAHGLQVLQNRYSLSATGCSAAGDGVVIQRLLGGNLVTNQFFQPVHHVAVGHLLTRRSIDIDQIVRRATGQADVGLLGFARAIDHTTDDRHVQ